MRMASSSADVSSLANVVLTLQQNWPISLYEPDLEHLSDNNNSHDPSQDYTHQDDHSALSQK